MFLAFITLAVALSISAVAIYYSVAGLVAIFASAAVPIMIMGGALEVGKLVTAVWLHKYWKQAPWWLKSYLSVSVIVLMFITSMGIFGFLSKAHIEQTSAGEESVAQVERLATEITRQNDVVKRAEEKINALQTSGTGSDAQVQSQIDKEQERIDNAYARIQPAIDEQNKIIGSQAGLYTSELAKIDVALAQLQSYIDAGEIKKAQAMVGAKADGAFGPNTAAKFKTWQTEQEVKRKDLLTKIEGATNNPQARAAALEIKRLRTTAETQVAESNKLINRLRTQVGKTDKAADIDAQVDEQTARIKTANTEIDTLTEEKYKLEGEYRKLEAEVGPIKYIAEFVYGEQADKNMLEKAVTWVIVIIIFVFDPLAVLLLIASQYTFEFHRKQKEEEQQEMPSDDWDLYQQARAERMAQNVPPTFTNAKSDDASTDDSMGEPLPGQTISTDDEGHSSLEQTEVQPDGLTPKQIVEPNYEADDGALTDDQIEQIKLQPDGLTEESKRREQQLEQSETDEKWLEAKRQWKEENPESTIKELKQAYIHGKIDELPWEKYLNDGSAKKYIFKEKDEQVTKIAIQEGYRQNSEQNEETLWQRLKRDES
jgi:hypothetical protein